MARQPLGRGLSALLGDSTPSTVTPTEVDIDLIDPNPEQPRTRFPEAALDELAKSIESNGIVQPVVVRKNGKRYQIVAGERRWRAAQRAGLRRIPVTIREIADDRLLEIALIENIQRQELNPVEEARAYRKLVETIGLTQEQISERVGKERTLVATTLRLLKLPADILELIEEGKLSAGHGRALLLSEDPADQRRAARLVIEKQLSVRETERIMRQMRSAGRRKAETERAAARPKDPNVRLAETKLMRTLGTNVRIVSNSDGKSGKIEIEYYNPEDLDRIYNRLLNSKEV
jgi:ParB family chromosome partitioning protein